LRRARLRANVNPKSLFLDLIEPQQVDPDFLDRMKKLPLAHRRRCA